MLVETTEIDGANFLVELKNGISEVKS